MPRDISGVYTLPAPMPVQPRTIPVTNIFNTVLTDVKDALNNIPGGALAPGSVDTAQLADNAVTNAKLADNAVNTAELADNSVTNAKMADNAVNTAELVDGAVTEPKLATDAVTTDKIVDGAVTNEKIQDQPTFAGPVAGVDGAVGATLELRKAGARFGAIGNTAGVDERLYVVSDKGAIQLLPNNLGLGTEEFVLLQKGQLRFPATANLSSDPNTMDDYEEGTWTPTFTCTTPGNLSVTYGARSGSYVKIGQIVYVNCRISIPAMTHSTASGTILVTGLPFPCPGEEPFPCSYLNNRPSGTVPMLRRAASTVPNYQTVLRVADLATGNTTEIQITSIPSPIPSTIFFFFSGWYNTTD